jgi:hypothetical protein
MFDRLCHAVRVRSHCDATVDCMITLKSTPDPPALRNWQAGLTTVTLRFALWKRMPSNVRKITTNTTLRPKGLVQASMKTG